MKEGRGRHYPDYGGIERELEYLAELRERAADLVLDLPDEVRASELHGHSIYELYAHMLQAESGWVSRVAGVPVLDVADADELKQFTETNLGGLRLDSTVSVGPFINAGQVIRHLQWHWTYHSAQIGMLRRMHDHPYKWTFAETIGGEGGG